MKPFLHVFYDITNAPMTKGIRDVYLNVINSGIHDTLNISEKTKVFVIAMKHHEKELCEIF